MSMTQYHLRHMFAMYLCLSVVCVVFTGGLTLSTIPNGGNIDWLRLAGMWALLILGGEILLAALSFYWLLLKEVEWP